MELIEELFVEFNKKITRSYLHAEWTIAALQKCATKYKSSGLAELGIDSVHSLCVPFPDVRTFKEGDKPQFIVNSDCFGEIRITDIDAETLDMVRKVKRDCVISLWEDFDSFTKNESDPNWKTYCESEESEANEVNYNGFTYSHRGDKKRKNRNRRPRNLKDLRDMLAHGDRVGKIQDTDLDVKFHTKGVLSQTWWAITQYMETRSLKPTLQFTKGYYMTSDEYENFRKIMSRLTGQVD
jgi:hypothetical protein